MGLDSLPLSPAYTDYGDDISGIIRDFNDPGNMPTQDASNYSPPLSDSSSSNSLGKRKASDSSSTLSLSVPSPKRAKIGRDAVEVSTNEPYIIAGSDDFTTRRISKLASGVQFEIARLVSLGRLDENKVPAIGFEALCGKNTHVAPEAARTILAANSSDYLNDPAFAQESAAKSPWGELDFEEAALAKDEYAGLGNSTEFPDWYGGKIEFRGALCRVDGSFQISLRRCSLGPSCRFTRRFGSTSMLRIKIPQNILHASDNKLNSFFTKPFVIWGRVFRAFYAKEDTVFLFRTNEALENGHLIRKRHPGLSLFEFVDWHNPLETNNAQTMTKWSARFALGLSNSFPGPRIAAENVKIEKDIISNAGSDMTDGCGFVSQSALNSVSHKLNCDKLVGIQNRFGGSKGIGLKHPNGDLDCPPTLFLRPSQIKIRYSEGGPPDPAHLTLEVLRTSIMRSPARLSPETIINLAENGVPHNVFVGLLRQALISLIEDLTTWDGPDAMLKLWANVERLGGVIHSRRAREAAGEARVRGYGDRHDEIEEEDEDDEGLREFDPAVDERSTAWWADQISGLPSSLEETVMVLLDAGFTPQTSHVLREKLKQVVTTKIKAKAQKFHYEVNQSARAFVVPDPCGVLEVDEIQVKSSHRNLQNFDGLMVDKIVGNGLLTRNPCKLPTDVRKVKLVQPPELHEYVDVIVCSTKGNRRLLDYLAGGDYDGDVATVIWAPEMVQPFQNADEKHASPPNGLEKCFSRDNERVDSFLARTAAFSEEEKVAAMQGFLLGSLRDTSIVGKYSSMHDNSIYKLGYDNPRTVRLAYKFTTVLDGAKTGLKILPETLRDDLKHYHHPRGPQWKEKVKKPDPNEFDTSNAAFLERGQGPFVKGKPFIMDVLKRAAKKQRDEALKRMDEVFSPLLFNPDPHLLQPWEDAVKMAERGSQDAMRRKKKDLSIIAVHVQAMFKEHRMRVQGKGKLSASVVGKGPGFTGRTIEVRQDILRDLSKKFTAAPRPDDLDPDSMMDEATIARLRASYAYKYDSEEMKNGPGWSRFPWNVATRELCVIKANALGPCKTATNVFYERFKITSSGRK